MSGKRRSSKSRKRSSSGKRRSSTTSTGSKTKKSAPVVPTSPTYTPSAKPIASYKDIDGVLNLYLERRPDAVVERLDEILTYVASNLTEDDGLAAWGVLVQLESLLDKYPDAKSKYLRPIEKMLGAIVDKVLVLMVESLASVMSTSDEGSNSHVAALFLELAKHNPSILIPHISVFQGYLRSPRAGPTIVSILQLIAESHPTSVFPLVSDLRHSIDGVASNAIPVYRLFTTLGQASSGYAATLVPVLLEMYSSNKNPISANAVLAIQSISSTFPGSVDPHLPVLREIVQDKDSPISAQNSARDIVNTYDTDNPSGVDDLNLSQLNSRVREQVSNYNDMKRYVSNNLRTMQLYVNLLQTNGVPIPAAFIVNKTTRTLSLSFACSLQEKGCKFPSTEPFTASATDQWKNWLKVGFCSMRLGMSSIKGVSPDAVVIYKTLLGPLDDLEEVTDETLTDEFLGYITHPFLLPHRQAAVISGLRESSRFFEEFCWLPNSTAWSCSVCAEPIHEAQRRKAFNQQIASIEARIPITGYLEFKPAGVLKKPRKFWVVLDTASLSFADVYYSPTRVLMTVESIEHVARVEPVTSGKNQVKPNTFEVFQRGAKNPLRFVADLAEEANEFIEVLEFLISNKDQLSSAPAPRALSSTPSIRSYGSGSRGLEGPGQAATPRMSDVTSMGSALSLDDGGDVDLPPPPLPPGPPPG